MEHYYLCIVGDVMSACLILRLSRVSTTTDPIIVKCDKHKFFSGAVVPLSGPLMTGFPCKLAVDLHVLR